MPDLTPSAGPALPTGTLTFFLTDIEGSTRLWERHPQAMRQAMDRHDALADTSIHRHGGFLVKHRGEGDSLFAVFVRATEAVAAACEFQQAISAEVWPDPLSLRVRIALHTGEVTPHEGDYYGPVINRCARVRGLLNGGQTALTLATQELVRETLPTGVTLRDLGMYVLKDLERPERLFQMLLPGLPADFPPLASPAETPGYLPTPLTSFIGREKEIAEVAHLLASSRLVTLAGAGGCGKTRLALKVATERWKTYAEGAWLVELLPITDPASLANTLAAVLGVREEPGVSLEQTLCRVLRPRSLLLVLDSCEHLVTACALLADLLLRHCPGVQILATSREVLDIAAERVYRVSTLSLPDPEAIETAGPEAVTALWQSEAVHLFCERAEAVLPAFALTPQNAGCVARICRRLDGLPLALELAAARVKVLAVEQIDARLDDRFRLLTGGSHLLPSRAQTLRAVVDWSYHLLSAEERLLLCRLSVFVGGWTLEAAEAVCADPSVSPLPPEEDAGDRAGEASGPDRIETEQILDLLTRLVDKSLVIVEGAESEQARYRLLETVGQFSQEALARSGHAASTQRRCRQFFLQMAEEAERSRTGPDQAVWLDRLQREYGNFRASLEAPLEEAADAEASLRLTGALGWFWSMRGYLREGLDCLRTVLARTTHTEPSGARAKALKNAGNLAWGQGNLEAARTLYDESRQLYQVLADSAGVADALHNLGTVAHSRGDYEGAHAHYTESLALERALGNPWGIAATLNNLGQVAYYQGDFAAARACFEESLALRRQIGDLEGIAGSLHCLGLVAVAQGELTSARDQCREGLAVFRQLGDRLGVAESLELLAGLAQKENEPERAARLYGTAEHLRETIGSPVPANEKDLYARSIDLVRASLGARFAALRAEGQGMPLPQAIAYALEETGEPNG